MDEIVNRIAGSALQVFDLEDYYIDGIRTELDIAPWLEQGFLLKEKDFRQYLNDHDWSQYTGHYVALFCSTDAIIPAWAFLLVTIHLSGFAAKVVNGSLEQLETSLYQDRLQSIDFGAYRDSPVIIKGCARKAVPTNAYLLAAQFLKPHARSIMYGEACSAVPLYKRK
ncbi:MAG: DUF2480 family protein [Flavobacterium sp.]|nr:DUF2480 family protein [Flavobacterium sp.]